MKKSTAVLALSAVVGLSVVSVSPAMAVTGAYPNCAAAAAEGVYNIPAGAPGYGAHLDSDSDGIGCENANFAYRPAQPVAVPGQQVAQMPIGGAATGVSQESGWGDTALVLGGGLVLMAAAGGTYVLRRRVAGRA